MNEKIDTYEETAGTLFYRRIKKMSPEDWIKQRKKLGLSKQEMLKKLYPNTEAPLSESDKVFIIDYFEEKGTRPDGIGLYTFARIYGLEEPNTEKGKPNEEHGA